MKNKKYSYILVFVLMLLMGIGRVFAAESSQCTQIFGSATDEESLRYLIDEILTLPKYLVPIIVIALGALDLAKAVIASKEDEIRKAQSTLIKRVFIGVVVFLIPTIIDLLMGLVDLIIVNNGACQI